MPPPTMAANAQAGIDGISATGALRRGDFVCELQQAVDRQAAQEP